MSAAAACHRGQDGDRVAVRERRGQAAGEADVLVVQVDVDESAQLAVLDQPVADAGVALVESGDHLAQRGALGLDALGAVGVGAQDGRNGDLDGHWFCSWTVWALARWRATGTPGNARTMLSIPRLSVPSVSHAVGTPSHGAPVLRRGQPFAQGAGPPPEEC